VRTGTSGIRVTQSVFRRSAEVADLKSNSSAGRANAIGAWLALLGLLIPSAEVQILIGGAKFTVGRLCIMLLLLPALVALCQRGRRALMTDVFACATAIWMIIAGCNANGEDSVTSSVAEAIEFAGGYLVARGLFFGPLALLAFLRALKIVALTLIVLATADSVSGRLIVHDAFASLLQVASVGAQYREGMVRATSTLDHAIHLGAFCSVVGIILLYSERTSLGRLVWVGICGYGCILSWSSSGLMSFLFALSAYGYDRLMKKYRWRWKAIWAVALMIFAMFFLSSNDPMSWIVSHLTLDPESGFFRFLIWEAATAKISESPLMGFGFQLFNHPILDATVDSVWLVMALRFGLPTLVLLALTNLSAMLSVKKIPSGWPGAPDMGALRTGFSMVLVMFMFIGLTVHYWNYLWIFWAICIGIRASLNEYTVGEAGRFGFHGPQPLVSAR
jgi:hypothetical protein